MWLINLFPYAMAFSRLKKPAECHVDKNMKLALHSSVGKIQNFF